LSGVEVAAGLVGVGFTGWEVVTMGAICLPESGRDAHEIHLNDDPAKASYLTLDEGLYQINEAWFPYLVKRGILYADTLTFTPQLLNPAVNFRCARAVYLEGSSDARYPVLGYRRWNTYVYGRHVPFLHQARLDARAVGVPV
jgi:hypothetical protein